MSSNDVIGQVLDLGPIDIEEVAGELVEYQPVPPVVEDTTREEDFAVVRDNILEMVEKGKTALDELLNVAKQSQHPRAYEVVTTMFKTLTDMNNGIIDMYKKSAEAKILVAAADPNAQQQTINNNLFVGSTHELQKLISNFKSNENPS